MNMTPTDMPAITLPPEGRAGVSRPDVGTRLAQVSIGDLQGFDMALRRFDGSQNRLLNASADLLAVCGVMTRLAPGAELNTTRVELSRAIIDLKYAIVRLDYPPSVAENLCLLFAIALDEFVMAGPLGANSGWENRTLVADLFGFRDGGDRFYNIADRALMQPKALREFLEILYIFLKLGYRGKYNRGSEHERDRLINRLEIAINLVPQPDKASAVGREVVDTRPPTRAVATRTKFLIAAIAITAITMGVWGARRQAEHRVYTDFTERRAIAENESAVDFVFSSTDGTVSARPRQ